MFGGVLGVTAPGVPYFLFALVGSSVWDLFSSCLMWATRSLQMNRGFLGRMYFPRVIVPVATMSLAFVNFLIMLAVMAVAFGYYYVTDGRLYLAGWSGCRGRLGQYLVAATLGLGIGLWTSPMNAQYRDVRFTLAYILEFWALLTPVMYPLSAIPPQYHWIVFIDPSPVSSRRSSGACSASRRSIPRCSSWTSASPSSSSSRACGTSRGSRPRRWTGVERSAMTSITVSNLGKCYRTNKAPSPLQQLAAKFDEEGEGRAPAGA